MSQIITVPAIHSTAIPCQPNGLSLVTCTWTWSGSLDGEHIGVGVDRETGEEERGRHPISSASRHNDLPQESLPWLSSEVYRPLLPVQARRSATRSAVAIYRWQALIPVIIHSCPFGGDVGTRRCTKRREKPVKV